MKPNALVIMAKEPEIGSTKTRLCPPLSFDEAAAISEALLLDTIQLISGIDALDLAIAITPPESEPYFRRISPPDTILIPVVCKDIGECQSIALKNLLEMGYQKVFALNADSPSLPRAYIQEALSSLDDHDLVLGPTDDGGYYLVGFKEHQARIFENVAWSTERVLDQVVEIANELDLAVKQIPSWYDVDTVEEIYQLQAELDNLAPDSLPNIRKFLTQWSDKK
jgi:rSAM/selenodomain-associated transferase 1